MSTGTENPFGFSDNKPLEEDPDLKNYVSESGEYLIPIEYTVYSTITVKADNLADALAKAKAQFDDVPMQTNYEYVDDSMRIAVDEKEDIINAQWYRTIGDTVLE